MKKTLIAALALSWAAWAAPITVDGHNDVRVVAGNGQDIVIEGHHLEVMVSGNSGRVTISGHHNQVVLENPASIDASGHHNQIVYRSGKPVLVNQGTYNEIVHGGGVITSAGASQVDSNSNTVQISGANSQRNEEGRGRNFSIAGSGNHITIRGQAGLVDVAGSGNVVTVEEARAIQASGMGNKIYYSKGNPEIDKSGLDNEVTRR